jgi:hypothetical protein
MTFPNEPDSRIAALSTDVLRPEWVEIPARLPGARDFVDLIPLVSRHVRWALTNVCMAVADLREIEG